MFTDLLHLLVITGGREHTIRRDFMAISKGKQILVCDCAPENHPCYKDGKVENAAGLLREHLHILLPHDIPAQIARM
jgi:hypothetical protein